MTTRSVSALGVLATWLLIDLWRVWTPSLITLFGRAAQTPAEVMGAYALLVMAVPLVIVAFLRRRLARWAGWMLLAAFVVRIALAINPEGGDIQLYGSSVGVVLAFGALCLCAGSLGRALVPSVLLGVAVSASTHALLGTFGAVWRRDGWDVALLIVQAVLVVVAMRGAARARDAPVAARTALLLPPVLLIVLLGLSDVGRGSVLSPIWGTLAVVVGVWAAVIVALLPAPRRRPWFSAVLFPAAVLVAVPLEVTRGGFEGVLSVWAAAGFVVGPAAAARLLLFAGAGRSPRTASVSAGVGGVIWTLLFFAFYAGYDLGYRADWVIFAAAVALAAWAVSYRAGIRGRIGRYSGAAPGSGSARGSVSAPDSGSAPASAPDSRSVHGSGSDAAFDPAEAQRIEAGGARAVAASAVAAVIAVIAALVGPALTIPTRPVAASATDRPLTVAAYNLRMGYALDGRFVPGAVAEQIRNAGAHVVLLSEVDRGWLLNGGQDQLAIMARMLGMRFVFGPAGDQVWGDAILTDLPVHDAGSQRYPAFDSLTGAGMTSATMKWGDTAVQVIATHLQPDGDELNATQGQAAFFSQALAAAAARGPVIGGGDLNTTPDTASWRLLLASGAHDALAPIRPAYTSPAEAPDQEIDHLFVAGMTVHAAVVVDSTLSDHRMITVQVQVD